MRTRSHAALAAIAAVAAIVVTVPGAARARREARIVPRGPIDSQLNAIVGAQPDRWGVLVKRLDDGTTIYAHNPTMLLAPASNEKVFTTAAALDALGPSWHTRTSVFAGSEPDRDGTLDGDLVLYGRGDPNLSGRFSATGDPLEPFRALAGEVSAHGVRRIRGGIVADDSYLTGAPHGAGWAWADIQWHFGAEVSALSFNDNLAAIQVMPGATAGEPCTVIVTPDVGYLEIVNTTTTTAGGPSKIAVHGALDAARVEISGTLALGYPGWRGEVAVHDPAGYAAAAFRTALAAAGVEVDGGVVRLQPDAQRPPELALDRLTEIAGLDSLPLSELIKVVNRHSQNLHAELVLRLLGREKGPRDLPNDQAGIAVVLQFLSRNSLLAPGIVIQDGSGLSRLDRSTAAVLQGLAVQMSTHPDAIYFYDSLPEGGEDGTLHRRLSGVMVRAKSGSLATSKSLTGYLTTAAGRRVAFSFVYNGPPGTSAAISQIDTMIEAIARADSP